MTTSTTQVPRETPQVVRCPDLRATVYPTSVPDGLAEELPALYSSLLSTLEWFPYFDKRTPTGACTLDHPRHVLLFCVEGDTIEVLNKYFDMSGADATRACRALFRAFPKARRIHLEIKCRPLELRVPRRVLYWTDHSVLLLPETAEQYTASLGKHTRTNLGHYERRLRREHPNAAMELIEPRERSKEFVDQFLEWKIGRFGARGESTMWEADEHYVPGFTTMVQSSGHAYVATIDGAPAAIWFVFFVGEAMFSYQGAFDPRYEPFALGNLMHYWVHCDAAERGVKWVHLGWGADSYMKRYGMVPVRATRVSLFRSQLMRVYSLREADAAMRFRVEACRPYYYRARHVVGLVVRRVVASSRALSQSRPKQT